MKFYIFFFFVFVNISILAQEVIVFPGQENIELKSNFKNKSIDTLVLPFFDDFSDTTNYIKHFTDNFVSIDYTQSVLPPSIGTACFDALDNNQEFYYSYNQSGVADFLTSKPFDLFFPGETTIYFSFYYEAQGLMDAPDNLDSLVLQFYAPNQDIWKTVWAKNNGGDISFKQVIIQISDTSFLHKGFKFRFYNKVSMLTNSVTSKVTNCDYWYVDYIYLNKNRNVNDTIRHDIAFQNYIKFKIDDYLQIPYSHYKEISGLNHNFYLNFRNNDNKLRNIDSMYFVFHDSKGILANDTLHLGSYIFGDFNDFYLDKDDINFTFPNTTADYLDYTVETKLITDTYDSTCNNVVNQHKRLSVTYAHDDGTAENAYGLFGDGTLYSYVSTKYFTYKTDYLTGLEVYFNKSLNNQQAPYFYPVVWENDEQRGVPGEIVFEQEGIDIDFNKLNSFQIFKFTEPVLITDTFYVGWMKTVINIMNVGLDRNSTNEKYNYYNISGSWKQSIIDGVLMIRPIFGNIDLVSNKELQAEEISFKIFPNPVENVINIEIKNTNQNQINYRIFDISGRIVYESLFSSDFESVDLSFLSRGIYILELKEQNQIYKQKFVKK